MNKELLEMVLPRLARRLQQALDRYRSGQLDEKQFSRTFESQLQRQYAWLASRGVPEPEAAVAIHAAVLILSSPGLRAEATEQELPLEVVEHRALRTAAKDIAQNYQVDEARTYRQMAALMARYAD